MLQFDVREESETDQGDKMCLSIPTIASLDCFPDGLKCFFSRITGSWRGSGRMLGAVV